jgi:cellobiose-specific phosphotransferase system component IIB
MQTILVIAAIGAATFFLARKLYRSFQKKDNSCDGCAMGKTENP